MSKSTSNKINVTLWTVQVILGALFLFAGGMKLVVPFAVLSKQMPPSMTAGFIHTISVLELLAGLGMILPGVLHLRSELTPLAAGGLIIIMSGAIGVTVATAPITMAAMPFAVGCLALFVAYGRTRLVPLTEKSRRTSARATSTGTILHHAA